MTKKIEAIFREEKLIAVKEALSEIGIIGMNVLEVRGHGRQGGIELRTRILNHLVQCLPRRRHSHKRQHLSAGPLRPSRSRSGDRRRNPRAAVGLGRPEVLERGGVGAQLG